MEYTIPVPEEVAWIVINSDSKIFFVGNNPNDNGDINNMPNHRILSVLDKLQDVEKVVLMDGNETLDHEKMITWDDFINNGKNVDESEIHSRIDKIKEEVVVELLEAAVPIPITIKLDAVKVIRRESED